MYKYSMHLHVRLSNPCCFSVQNKGSQAAVLISKVPPSYLGAWISLRRKICPQKPHWFVVVFQVLFKIFKGVKIHGGCSLISRKTMANTPWFWLKFWPPVFRFFGPLNQSRFWTSCLDLTNRGWWALNTLRSIYVFLPIGCCSPKRRQQTENRCEFQHPFNIVIDETLFGRVGCEWSI